MFLISLFYIFNVIHFFARKMNLLLVQKKHLRWPDRFSFRPNGHTHISYPHANLNGRTSKLIGPLELQLVLCVPKCNNVFLQLVSN
jgi:hypothetical protein